MELLGRTILITRAAAQSEELREALEKRGARVLECPLIDIVPLEDWSEVDQSIRRLDSYHWLLFTSANGVDHFMQRLGALGAPCNPSIAAVGSVTARQLQRWHRSVSLVPEDFRAEGLLDAFPADMTGVRVLFPRAETAREILPDELRRRGATVDVVTVYRTVQSSIGTANLRPILTNETIDCVVLTSPSAIRFLMEILAADAPQLLSGTAIAVNGPVAREAAEASGLRVAIEPRRPTTADLVSAIENYFKPG